MIRKVIFYSGRVQGVGFRYTTAKLAKRFDVAGYVQNLDDGRVRLDVQGGADQVDGLIAAVQQALGRNITHQDTADHPADPALGKPSDADAFNVRY